MKKCFLALLVICVAIPAFSETTIFGGIQGSRIFFAALEENGSKLTLKDRTEFDAKTTVGNMWLDRFVAGEWEAFYTEQKPSGAPGFGRATFRFGDDGFSTIGNRHYQPVIGDYRNLGVYPGPAGGQYYLFRTRKSPKEDLFGFSLNSALNPVGAGKKMLDNLPGTIVNSSCISLNGRFGGVSTYHPSQGDRFHFFSVNGRDLRVLATYTTSNRIINCGVADDTNTRGPIFVFRELAFDGSRYSTSVSMRQFDPTTGQPRGPNRRLTGPSILSGGPGSFDYDSLFFNTVAITSNGKWALYTKPAIECTAFEVWARRLNPSGGFAGAPFRPFGQCNKQLGNGTEQSLGIRSMTIGKLRSF